MQVQGSTQLLLEKGRFNNASVFIDSESGDYVVQQKTQAVSQEVFKAHRTTRQDVKNVLVKASADCDALLTTNLDRNQLGTLVTNLLAIKSFADANRLGYGTWSATGKLIVDLQGKIEKANEKLIAVTREQHHAKPLEDIDVKAEQQRAIDLEAAAPVKDQGQDNIENANYLIGRIRKEEFLTHEGIFRLAGSETLVTELLKLIKINTDMVDSEVISIDNLATLLKRILKENQPLKKIKEKLLDAMKLPEEEGQVEAVITAINTLPVNEQEFLKNLFLLLSDISKESKTNKMTPSNLSIVVGPNMFIEDDPIEDMQLTKERNELTTFLIKKYEDIFVPEEEPPIGPS